MYTPCFSPISYLTTLISRSSGVLKLNPAAPSSIEEIQETQDLRFYGNDFLYVIDIFLVFSGDVVWTWEGRAGGGRGGL